MSKSESISLQPVKYYLESNSNVWIVVALCLLAQLSKLLGAGTYTIFMLELRAAGLALRAFTKDRKQIHVHLRLDNRTVVAYLSKQGGTRSLPLLQETKEALRYCLWQEIPIIVEYLPWVLNGEANHESCVYQDNSNWQLDTTVFAEIQSQWETMEMNLFVDRLNTQLKVFASWRPDPMAKVTDAFSFAWKDSLLYAFPPFCLVGRCLAKLAKDGGEMVLMVPTWHTQMWYPKLLAMLTAEPLLLPLMKDLLRSPMGQDHPLMMANRLQLVAWRISGKFAEVQCFQNKLPKLWTNQEGKELGGLTATPGKSGLAGVSFGRRIVQAPVELVANFLTEKFQSGLAYLTMNVYRSAISAKHSLVQGLPVGQHTMIVKLLKGMFNEKPPQPKYMGTWDAAVVLDHMSLRDLSLEVCMLMALTSASRASELHKLKISGMLDKGEEIEFHIAELKKGRKVGDRPLVVRFVQYEAEPNLNVVQCLRAYLEATEGIRAPGVEGEQLLISFKLPHGALAKSSVARWLKMNMQEAGIDTKVFQAHSTRAAATSKTESLGLSVQQIMDRQTGKEQWRLGDTITRKWDALFKTKY